MTSFCPLHHPRGYSRVVVGAFLCPRTSSCRIISNYCAVYFIGWIRSGIMVAGNEMK